MKKFKIVILLGIILLGAIDSEYYELVYGGTCSMENKWLPDVDGSYGSNDNGIFFFTPDGKYIEWTGTYLYSDIPFEVKDTVVTYKEVQ